MQQTCVALLGSEVGEDYALAEMSLPLHPCRKPTSVDHTPVLGWVPKNNSAHPFNLFILAFEIVIAVKQF